MDKRWITTEVGSGSVSADGDGFTLALAPITDAPLRYHNAQITDYTTGENGFHFDNCPPMRFTIRMKMTVEGGGLAVGTAGFGVWNHPFSPDVKRLPRLPSALWCFYASPPNNMALARGVPRHGWKAATIDAGSPRGALTLAALIPAGIPLALAMRNRRFYERVYPVVQRGFGITEHDFGTAMLNEFHTYTIEWKIDGAHFLIDDQFQATLPHPPRRALGFIAWIDNQYAVVTPQGALGSGIIPIQRAQMLHLEHIEITKGE